MGTVSASQAITSTAAPVSARMHGGDGHDKGDNVVVDNSKHQLSHSCKGETFGYCTQKVNFAPKLLGPITLIGTTGLIGITGTTGTTGTDGTTGTTGTDGTTGTTGTTTPPGDAEWCSPGFWRNHPEDWPVPTDTLWSASIGGTLPDRTPSGIANGAPTDPSLLYLLEHPQYYGGDDTNTVADYLSIQAGLNFTGARVDNCPL
ncbi:hypothetical protein ACIPWI_27890 [Streptomyces sp. NPDC090046]|uniref:hypothetical protein n=1 Tax=Streptomyces sp. NPDC090046 TaxID=3365928 RepID=UPI0038055477